MPQTGPGTTLGDYPRSRHHDPDWVIVGPAEWCALSGTSPGLFYKWVKREVLPPADGPVVNGVVTWRLVTLLAWAAKTERLTGTTQAIYDTLVGKLGGVPRQPFGVYELEDEVRAGLRVRIDPPVDLPVSLV